MEKYCFFYNFPLCSLGIVEEDGAISGIFFTKRKALAALKRADIFNEADIYNEADGFYEAINFEIEDYIKKETPLIKKAAAQLGEYFEGKRKNFDLPLSLHGTDFQLKVWKALQKIPYGKMTSYGEIARVIGNAAACRAVGMANNRNPIAIVVPCHRVIGKDGSLTGYGGGLDLKEKLLKLENVGI